jgi:hypothetical protein
MKDGEERIVSIFDLKATMNMLHSLFQLVRALCLIVLVQSVFAMSQTPLASGGLLTPSATGGIAENGACGQPCTPTCRPQCQPFYGPGPAGPVNRGPALLLAAASTLSECSLLMVVGLGLLTLYSL